VRVRRRFGSGVRQFTQGMFLSDEDAVKAVDGKFLMANLLAGREAIKVTHPDYSFTVIKDIEVRERLTTEEVQVVLSRGGTVEGYVYDVNGRPQPNVTLHFQNRTGSTYSYIAKGVRFATVVTNPDGFYRVAGLPERLCTVVRGQQWLSLGVVGRTVAPVNGKTLKLDLGGAPTVSGQLIIEGMPLGNTKLRLFDSLVQPPGRLFHSNAMTDTAGRFRFMGAPPGQYTIYYEHPERRHEWATIETIEVGRSDLDLGVIPSRVATVSISVTTESQETRSDSLDIHLEEEAKSWAKVGTVTKPERPGDPYTVTHVPPGTYSAVATLSKFVYFRETVHVNAKDEEYGVALRIPEGTASVFGKYSLDSENPLGLWSADKRVSAYIWRHENDTYEIERLPPGKYVVGYSFIGSSLPLIRFTLAEGERKNVNIDSSVTSAIAKAFFKVQIIGDGGLPLPEADVRLTGKSGDVSPLLNSSAGQLFVTEPGEYVLHAVRPGYRERTRRVYLKQNELTGTRRSDSAMIVRLERE